MSIELMALFLLGGLVILLAIGIEVFAAVGITAVIGMLFIAGQPLTQFPQTAFKSANSFDLAALPLFIFMGTMFSNTGVARSLFEAADKWFGVLPGGLVSSVIGVNGIFGAICGSAAAATATFGKLTYPEFERLGYDPKLALGALAAGGVLSAAIPPSATMIVYGAWSDTSVPRLFAAILIPGIMLALLFMLTVIIRVKLNPNLVPKPPKSTLGERLIAIRDLLPWIGTIVVVLGVIFGGIMTPTESAALGAALSIILSVAYRRMSFTALKESMWTAIKITSMFIFLFFTAQMLTVVFVYMGITESVSAFLLNMPFGDYGIIAAIAIIYLVGGMFIEDWTLLLLTIPFILPVIRELGFTNVWFGAWFTIWGIAGVITPPFGLCLFVLHSVVPKHDIITIALGAWPFVIPMIIMGILLVIFPQLALWLPNLLY